MIILRARSGIVLPTVIGVLVMVELLAITILAVAYQELAVARERVAATQAQLASRSGAARIVSGQHGEVQSLSPGQRRLLWADSSQWLQQRAELERLTSALFLLRNVTYWGPASLEARSITAQLLMSFDPQAALNALPAALNVSSSVDLLTATLAGGSQSPAAWPASICTGFPEMADSASALALNDAALLHADSATRISGSPPVTFRALPDAATLAQLGGIPIERLVQLADRRDSSAVPMSPTASGAVCVRAAAGNFGAPLDSSHPCHDYFPFSFAPGSLDIEGGAGQGTLLVNGDLTLRAGARFYGLLLVRGRLIMEPGSQLLGAALANSATLNRATIERSPCALRRALRGARAWNQLRLRPGRAWLPVF